MFSIRGTFHHVLRTTLLAAVIISGGMIFFSPVVPSAYADGSCTSPPSGGGLCAQMNDVYGQSLNCANNYGGSMNNGSFLNNTYQNICLRTWIMWGTGDGKRYSWYDMWVTPTPDTVNGIYNYQRSCSDPSCADSSSPGTFSTVETRVWSTARGCGPGCDQENYVALQAPSKCAPNSNTQGMSAALTVGVIQITWSQSNTLYYGCTNRAPADPYSAYFDYTLLSSGDARTPVTEDYTSGQYSSNHYNNSFITVGYSAKSQYAIWKQRFPTYAWITPFNYGDTFKY